jgi:hypothetical protein
VNFEDQNKVLESSTIIINYRIIIISAYYLINALYNYYTSNKDLLEEYDKEEKVEVTGSCYFLLKKIVKHSVQCHVLAQSPPSQNPNDKYPITTSHYSRFV